MAKTREQIEAEIATIDAALSTGVTVVQKGDRRVQYDTPTLERRRKALVTELGALSPARMIRRVYPVRSF